MPDERPARGAGLAARRIAIAIAIAIIVGLVLVGAIAAALLAHPSSSAGGPAVPPGPSTEEPV